MRKIRVLVVEDSMVFRELLFRNLNMDPGIEVVATARDPFEARDMILAHKPDVMTLDIELPRMSGIEFLRKLMPQYPIPVVMISSLSDKVFDAMTAGAVDFVCKPPAGASREDIENFIRTELPVKIKIASVAKLNNTRRREEVHSGHYNRSPVNKKDMVIAIGASTGGTEAIYSVVKGFHKDIPGVVIVQHMPAGFTKMYAKRLNDGCEGSRERRCSSSGVSIAGARWGLSHGACETGRRISSIIKEQTKGEWTLSVSGGVV